MTQNTDELAPKGPFTGKGRDRRADVLAQLAGIDQQRRALLEEAARLVRQFRAQYPRSPIYISRYADRSLTTLRWRRSGGTAASLDLLGEDGERILRTLPRPVRRDYLNYEQRRLALNARLAVLAYEERRLKDWEGRLERLGQLRRALLDPAA